MTKEEILTQHGCPSIPFDENVTMYYPAILSAMDEYAEQEVETARKHWEPKFIRVSEELPEIDESTKTELGYYSKPVLCSCDGWRHPQILTACYLPDKRFNGWVGNYVVIKWMPIPQWWD